MQHLQPNTTLQGGKYIIERVLGQGGFGITYLAENTFLHNIVAIKELFVAPPGQVINSRRGNRVTVTNGANQGTFDMHKKKFRKEASRLMTLHHKNLVRVHECFEENGTVYYAMDYIEGESLRAKLNRKGALSENLVMSYLNQLLSALQIVHRQNIWHLDIKPENIMVNERSQIYLIDFGASKHIEQNGTLTTSFNVASTLAYCPIEQLTGNLHSIGAWSDMYALGATLYNLLTNQTPPAATDLLNTGTNAFRFPASVSKQMRDMIVWMMKVNRNERPQSVSEVLNKIDNDDKTIIPPHSLSSGKRHNQQVTKLSNSTDEKNSKNIQNRIESNQDSEKWYYIWCVFLFLVMMVPLFFDNVTGMFIGTPLLFISGMVKGLFFDD